jgi:phosphonate degradation associated HDIG domain protein
MDILNVLRNCFATAGPRPYAGETVTQVEHALQCAASAELRGASDSLVAAAFLHDIGHMIDKDGEHLARRGVDARHERQGAEFLGKFFPLAISEPVRLHVAANAYLCAIEPDYHRRLSPVSQRSLELQGGAMSAADADAFRKLPFAEHAVLLRRWDDLAKEVGRKTPSLEHFLAIVEKTVAAPSKA